MPLLLIPTEAADLLQKLSLESQTKALEIPEPTKKPSADSGDAANGQIQSFDRSVTPLLPDFMDPSMCYLPNGYPSTAYYYGAGYDATGTQEWDEYSRYMNAEGVEMPTDLSKTQGVYGDNGSVMYHGYGYAPYGPYSPAGSPVPTVGHDGQLYGAQHYQYPSPYFQPLTPTSGSYPSPAVPPKGEIAATTAADQAPLSVDTTNGNTNAGSLKGNNGSAPVRPMYQNSSYNTNGSYGRGSLQGGITASGYQDLGYGFDGLRSPIPWLEGPMYSNGHSRPVTNSSSMQNGHSVPSSKSQNYRPYSNHMVGADFCHLGLHHPRPLSGLNTTNGYMNRMYPNKLYGQYGNTYRSGVGFGSNAYDSRTNGRGWLAVDNKYKPRGRGNGFYGYGNENMDGLNELNRGPRAKSSKSQKGFSPVALAVKGQNIPLTSTNDGEKDKPSVTPDREQYNRVDFQEDYADAKFFIIKSYSEDDVHKSIKYNVWASTPNGNKKLDAAYQEAQLKSGDCPVFLLFSVNTSGQFVGIAEMVGCVDFNKNVEYWQQDKWIGCFPVKWHIVKDVPNSLLKHITLENNENKPVTNSRDTQEVWEGKPIDEKNKEGTNVEVNSQKSTEVASELVKEPTLAVQTNGDIKLPENGSVVKSLEAPKVSKPVVVSEKKVVANGVANGC
ncbi:hypothetical protein RJ640_013227 [Escallonia rubra]|uniref:YTH domain-containing family protein n=1 Tax=Escallonia rubra TaxID=112253 RepID=A0AA88R6G0_9ASTE|nr:hypothetical protein RJ640_013227 [Escallonia rubra]